MAPTKTNFIKKHIQADNLMQVYRFSALGLAAGPLITAAAAGVVWGQGNPVGFVLLWGLAAELLMGAAVFVIRRSSGSGSVRNARMIQLIWMSCLGFTDLLAFNLKNEVMAQLVFWIITMLFTVCYVSFYVGYCQGMVPQLAVCVGMMLRRHAGAETVMFHCLLFLACTALSYLTYRLSEQKYINLWQLKLADSEAETDPMTGLYNRRGFEHRFHKLIEACANWHRPLAVFMMDIDFFKKYNDAFGHPEGDKCIIAVAGEIRKMAQKMGGICARIGGEEFMLVLTNDSESNVIEAAEHLSQAVEELKLRQAPGNFYPYVTISVGIQYCRSVQKTSIDELYEQADRALYLAKANGRNTIYMGQNCVGKKRTRYYA